MKACGGTATAARALLFPFQQIPFNQGRNKSKTEQLFFTFACLLYRLISTVGGQSGWGAEQSISVASLKTPSAPYCDNVDLFEGRRISQSLLQADPVIRSLLAQNVCSAVPAITACFDASWSLFNWLVDSNIGILVSGDVECMSVSYPLMLHVEAVRNSDRRNLCFEQLYFQDIVLNLYLKSDDVIWLKTPETQKGDFCRVSWAKFLVGSTGMPFSGKNILNGGHSIAPKTTSANAASASP